MAQKHFRHIAAFTLALSLAGATVSAQTAKPTPEKLNDKENPLLVGKRDINKGQINFYSLEKEVALGRYLANEVDRESRLVTDPAVLEFVNRITQNIVLHSDAKVPFTVKVVDAEEVNAFALPGGFLYVNRGLLEAADNEAEVAGVLAHEISHVTARHGVEQASKGDLLNYASIPLLFLGGWPGYILQQAAGLAVPLTFLKFSRGAEKEADRLGAQYMWAAGYDPQALVTFFEKLQGKEKKKPGTLAKIFSSHPMTGDRITEVQKLLARFPERNEYQLSTSEFNNVKARVVAASSAARPLGNDGKRPTLRRRPQGAGDNDAGAADDNRPVLKRRESAEETGEPATDSTNRPVLKRREGSPTTEEAKPAEPKPEAKPEEGKPTLKRRPDANNNGTPDKPF